MAGAEAVYINWGGGLHGIGSELYTWCRTGLWHLRWSFPEILLTSSRITLGGLGGRRGLGSCGDLQPVLQLRDLVLHLLDVVRIGLRVLLLQPGGYLLLLLYVLRLRGE